jgi:glycosyltransferase involved in cell wall biosynthesis
VVPRADPAALAAALGRLLHDPELGRALGARARERVERCFSPGTVGAQLRRILLREKAGDDDRSVAGEHRASGPTP